MLNSGLTPDEAEQLVAEGKIAAAQFGVLWLTHPDLAKRLEHGKALDNQIDFAHLYGAGPEKSLEDQRVGYTDYPEAVY